MELRSYFCKYHLKIKLTITIDYIYFHQIMLLFIWIYIYINVYRPSPVISICLKGNYTTSHDIYAASHRFSYGIDQLYLRKVPYYLID